MSDQERITELEIKVAYLESTLKTLDDELYQQQRQITALIKQLKELQDKYDEMQFGLEQGSSSTSEKPPHY